MYERIIPIAVITINLMFNNDAEYSKFLNTIKSGKKNIKFYPLNSLTFTANPKYNDNKIFLSMKIKE